MNGLNNLKRNNMKNIFYFILGVCLIILTSATTVSVMTVKPEKPKQIVVEIFDDEYVTSSIKTFIENKHKQGWILKEIVGFKQNDYKSDWVVVMEKY